MMLKRHLMDPQLPKYLPSEILTDILCRLPVKSVLRCMSVSKTCHQIIGTTSFINTHLTYQNTHTYILYDQTKSYSLLPYSDSINLDGPYHSKLKYTPDSFGTDYSYVSRGPGEVRIYDMCNGVLCLSKDDYHTEFPIYLWNPMVRKAKKLPNLEIPIGRGCYTTIAGLSFGYYDNDYKVIVIAPVGDIHSACVYGEIHFVCVYSLSINSWKIIRTNLFMEQFHGFEPCQPSKFVHGTSYMATTCQRIVCFDLRDQTICAFKIPRELLRFCSEFSIEAYGESVALLSCEKFYSRYLAMWVLRDKSPSSPWEKKFVIELQQVGFSCPQGFLSPNKYLIRTIIFDQHVTKLFLCDLETQKLTEFRSRVGPYPDFVGCIYSNYVESLVLLNESSLDPVVDMEIESETASSSSTSSASFVLYKKIRKEQEK